ncbi:hypothetical protein FQA47_025086 [Oryzias melastigma]|uniref:Uncharacterized protein n=1 Tax=Oryzias melastigma TaxID=30732 RepID=A0A834CSV2_ORYME|nr:hypothetical protein FQA47_025086 [Oryzias melastigma]
MNVIGAAVFSALFCTVVSSSSKVHEEHRTAFFGEDVHIDIKSLNDLEVVFKPRTKPSMEVFIMRAGKPVNESKAQLTYDDLVLKDVQEEDEGVYIIRSSTNSSATEHFILTVRDCSLEQMVKYGDTFTIHLKGLEGPIALEFRPSLIKVNQTHVLPVSESPPVLLYNKTSVLGEDYASRLRVTEKQVILTSVRMTDEGSFTVIDREGQIKMKNCLNVKDHQIFLKPTEGENLKIKLYQPFSNVSVVFKLKSDNQDRVIISHGVLEDPLDPQLDGRLTVEGTEITIKKINSADTGNLEAYKLPPLTTAILALLGLVAFMLLVCLLSCLYSVHKRNEKNRKLMLIAQQAGKGDGEAFRQVVAEAYTRFTEESLTQSVCDKPSECTEVTIKGLEVSKPGRYHTLSSDNFLEMSDSGVEFNSSGLPLDSDTDAAMTYASHKPLLNAASPPAVTEGVTCGSPEATAVPDGDLSVILTPDSVTSPSPASNPHSLTVVTPDGSQHGAASPGVASRGTAGSAKSEEEAEGEGLQKE